MPQRRLPISSESPTRDGAWRKHDAQALDGPWVATRRGACHLDLLDGERRYLIIFVVPTRRRGRRGACDGDRRRLIWRRRCSTSIGGRCVGGRGGSDGIGVRSVEPVVEDLGPAGRIRDRDTEAYIVEQPPLL